MYLCFVLLNVVLWVFMFFQNMFLFVCFVLLCFRLVCLSFCIYNRTNTYNNRNKQKHSKENGTNITRKNINLPARPWEIFIFRGGSWAGYPVFLFFLECLCCLYVSFCLFLCFRLVFLSFRIYNRTKTHIKTKNT